MVLRFPLPQPFGVAAQRNVVVQDRPDHSWARQYASIEPCTSPSARGCRILTTVDRQETDLHQKIHYCLLYGVRSAAWFGDEASEGGP